MPSTKRLCERAGLSTCIVVLLMIVPGAPAAAAEGDVPGCKPVIGRVVSRQGTVEIRRTGDSVWHRVERLDTQVCDGDAIRTGPRSRAALWLQPENLIRLDQRTAVTIAGSEAETKVEFFASGQVSADPDCGAAYFISRFPRNFGVNTPFLSAAIKGTEFLVAAQCSATTLAVFEGIVTARELLTGREFLVTSLEQVSVGPGLPSTIPIPIKPRDGVQWTIYYPRIRERYQQDQRYQADVCATGQPGSVECAFGNVEALLAVGAIKEAQAGLVQLRVAGIGGSSIAALEAVILIALNERDSALGLAESAVQSEPENFRAWSALSYARQAKLDLQGALGAAERASALEGGAFGLARVSELLLALGRTHEATAIAEKAVATDPQEPRALQVLGFCQLAN
ncbi:MAG: FecR domain-containing protein [Burkholderiales bacterium]|nr:FecR domain-containing protein [Burkholderiales bacterium]